MSVRFSDLEIEELVKERKLLPNEWQQKLVLRQRRISDEGRLEIGGEKGTFVIILRQSRHDKSNFCASLGLLPLHSNRIFCLRRYNGGNSSHHNRLERTIAPQFHIHKATEAYQSVGADECRFAEDAKGRFCDLERARKCLFEDCNVRESENGQRHMEFDKRR